MFDFIFVTTSAVWGGVADMRVRLSKAIAVLTNDLQRLSSLYVAHFIVWRELRRRRRQEKV
jgi:hypothetical protein